MLLAIVVMQIRYLADLLILLGGFLNTQLRRYIFPHFEHATHGHFSSALARCVHDFIAQSLLLTIAIAFLGCSLVACSSVGTGFVTLSVTG